MNTNSEHENMPDLQWVTVTDNSLMYESADSKM